MRVGVVCESFADVLSGAPESWILWYGEFIEMVFKLRQWEVYLYSTNFRKLHVIERLAGLSGIPQNISK